MSTKTNTVPQTTPIDDNSEDSATREKGFSEEDLKNDSARGLRIKTGLRAGGLKSGH